MELFSRPCRCARAAAKLCCRCCCFLSRSPPCNPWCRPRASFLVEMARRASGSYCFSPMMWCLLLLVWHYSKPSCKQNETRLPNPRGCDGSAAGLRLLRSNLGCSHGADDGRCSAHLLLSCAFRMDGVFTLLREPGRFGDLPRSAKRKSGCDRARVSRSGSRFLHSRIGDGTDLGAPGVGYLVDLGHSPHDYSGFVADLCQLSGVAALLG